MKQLKKMIDHLKSKPTKSPNDRTQSLFKVLAACFFAGVFAVPTAANAQATGCLANETAQTISFATPNWVAGAGGPVVYNGVTANAGNATATVTAATANTVATPAPASPNTQQSGGFADAFYYLVNRTTAAGSNVFTITFNKPVRNLKITATDIDTIDAGGGGVDGGKYQDAVTFTGNGPSGAVVPTATSGALVTVVGNTATAANTGTTASNCAAASANCNAVFTYAAPITSLSMSYFNGPLAAGDPPAQVVGIANIGFCVQNPDLSLVKDDAGASFAAGSTGTYSFAVSNTGSAATSGTTTVKDILPAGMSFSAPLTLGGANAAAWTCAVSTTTSTNDTATCTSTTAIAAAGSSTFTLPVSVVATAGGTTLTNRAKVFGGGDPNKAAETTTGTIAACPSDSLAGAVANAGCGFETTPIISAASIVITKTDSKDVATVGGTNAYVVTLTNQGPSPASGVILTDTVGAGLTCPAASAVTCTVTGAGAVCPAGPLTFASLTAGVAVATLPINGALQFAYTCNVN
jgi:uncharacterized repeat protein (TIGR01451 family)